MMKLITEGMPLKIKGMYALNVPWWVEAASRLALALLPAAIRSKIHFASWYQVP